MRFTTVLTGFLAVAVSSASAGPVHRFRARDETIMKARDLNVVTRAMLQAVHSRELPDLEARAAGIPSALSKRREPLLASEANGPNPARDEPPAPQDQGTVVEPQHTPEQQAQIDAQNDEIRNRPAQR
ncbi:hypothetical protein EIP91_002104 [Steccherinum ochraceum]|uniref:Uncharacterized protein n=1 Tax=Steccherinum ochraceum TaxID=92696 RepID=A0A4R0S0W5_9APHY|nr:hypothetical protein EIP91_002104 [Steccherinum ochraceum]